MKAVFDACKANDMNAGVETERIRNPNRASHGGWQ